MRLIVNDSPLFFWGGGNVFFFEKTISLFRVHGDERKQFSFFEVV